ncbi:MAG: ABC transporter ATP-binding protein [Chitinispirillaceae bacterium]|nr:ABC transporter ATP-binding protein [Chitinispirillaceae bacterium]
MFKLLRYLTYFRFAFPSVFFIGLISLTLPLSIGLEPSLGKMLFEKIFVTFDPYLLYKYLGIQVVLIGFTIIFNMLSSIHGIKVFISVANAIKEKMLKRLFHTRMKFFHEHDSGFLIKRITEDSDAISGGISAILTVVCNAVNIVCIGYLLYLISDWVCYSYCLYLVVSMVWIPVWLKPIHCYNLKLGNLYSDLYSYFFQIMHGIKEVKTNNLYQSVDKKIMVISNKIKRTHLIVLVFYSLLYQLSFFFPMALYVTLLVIGLDKIDSGVFSIGMLLGLFSVLWGIYQPVQNIFSTIDTIQQGITAAERMKVIRKASLEKSGKKKLEQFQNTIEFKNLSFSYDADNIVLNNIDVSIKKGEKVAIVGATGSGKSTFAQLLVGLIDADKGDILIDGVKMSDFTIKSLRDAIVYTTQDVHLFRDTIKNNIDLKGCLAEEDVFDIVKKVQLYDLINSLPEGIHSKIGDDGLSLSGGEKQRIAIARSFAAGAQIMLFDEVTASLDPEIEKLVVGEIEKFTVDKTVVFISHRLEAIKRYDKIIVLKDGKIDEIGTHEELSSRNGEYYSLFNLV